MGKRHRIIEVLREDYPLTKAEIALRTSLTVDQVDHVLSNEELEGQFLCITKTNEQPTYQLNDNYQPDSHN